MTRGIHALRFLAVLVTAICLIPAGAHFFEMFTKLKLPPQDYMIVQRIYADWAFFGIAIYGALLLTLTLTFLARGPERRLAGSAFVALALTQVVFWAYTQPMNALTQNWTRVPADIEAARRQWEYSHAANFGITLVAFALVLAAVLAGSKRDIAR